MLNRGEAVENSFAPRSLRVAAVAVTGLLPLVTIPGWESPFSTPKLILLALWLAAGFVALVFQPGSIPVPEPWLIALLTGWGALVALSALAAPYASLQAIGTALMPIACFILLVLLRPSPYGLAVALICSALAVALCALLQFGGMDPFRFLGWQPPDGLTQRMRIYSTLGNPNFVCVFLCGVVPLLGALEARRRSRVHSWLAVLAAMFLSLAILATGSRAPVLAVAAVLLWLVVTSGPSRVRLVIPLTILTVLVIGFSSGRRLDETVRGRFYIWETVVPFLSERPFLGWGPGSFQLKYAQWETDRLARDSGAVPARFAGMQDHAHNDYLEVAVERGWFGVLLLVLTPACLLGNWLRRQPVLEGNVCLGRWAGASVLVVMSVALVDFPLHRPAEGVLFWTLLALVYLCSRSNSDGLRRADQDWAENRMED